MCDHGEDKKTEYLDCIRHHKHEIHRCECGALIDIRAAKNASSLVTYSMTADEIAVLLDDLFQPYDDAIMIVRDAITRLAVLVD